MRELSLVEKAKRQRKNKKSPMRQQQEIHLAVAWLRGEITSPQVIVALGCNTRSYSKLYTLALALKAAYKKGIIQIPSDALYERLKARPKKPLDVRDIGSPHCIED